MPTKHALHSKPCAVIDARFDGITATVYGRIGKNPNVGQKCVQLVLYTFHNKAAMINAVDTMNVLRQVLGFIQL